MNAARREGGERARRRVVVVGAGVIGLATAWRCAQRGHDVTICDPEPGRGASWAAAGMLAPTTEAAFGEHDKIRLDVQSLRMWPDFAQELTRATGHDIGFRTTGTLSVARDTDDLAHYERMAEFQREVGLDVERLSSRECRKAEPLLAPSIRGGFLAADDHQVDNRALVESLKIAVIRAGVTLRRVAVARVDHDGGAVRAVVDGDGSRIDADIVVLAAGWATSRIAVDGLVVGPTRPVKGQLLHLRATAAFAQVPGRTIRGLDVYLVPRADGRMVVGATMEEVGADLRVTAGAVHELLDRARELVPGTDELDLDECVAGLRPGSPDNAPILGSTDVDGLLVATGHHRNGVLLTPVTAEALADMIDGDMTTPRHIAAFAPGRLDADRLDVGARPEVRT